LMSPFFLSSSRLIGSLSLLVILIYKLDIKVCQPCHISYNIWLFVSFLSGKNLVNLDQAKTINTY
jgi:hypothetical protein